MPAANPSVVNLIVARMESEAECVSIERRRTVEVGDLQDDRHQPTVIGHLRTLPHQPASALGSRIDQWVRPESRSFNRRGGQV